MTLDVMMPQAGCCIVVGLECGCAKGGATCTPRHECALDLMLCMLSQHHEIGLQTNCMVVVLALVVRLLDSRMHALLPQAMGCHPVIMVHTRTSHTYLVSGAYPHLSFLLLPSVSRPKQAMTKPQSHAKKDCVCCWWSLLSSHSPFDRPSPGAPKAPLNSFACACKHAAASHLAQSAPSLVILTKAFWHPTQSCRGKQWMQSLLQLSHVSLVRSGNAATLSQVSQKGGRWGKHLSVSLYGSLHRMDLPADCLVSGRQPGCRQQVPQRLVCVAHPVVCLPPPEQGLHIVLVFLQHLRNGLTLRSKTLDGFPRPASSQHTVPSTSYTPGEGLHQLLQAWDDNIPLP